MIGYIYKYTMIPTNKIYVGQHQTELVTLDEKYWGGGTEWKKDLKKFGYENVKREIIEWCDTFEKLNERELYWIAELDARNPKIGYNIKIGGQDNMKGENNPHYGIHTNYGGGKRTPWTEDQRRHLSEGSLWKKLGISNRAGCKITEEQKNALQQGFEKIDNWSEINKNVWKKRYINGTASTKKIQIRNKNTGEVFESKNKAVKKYGKIGIRNNKLISRNGDEWENL